MRKYYSFSYLKVVTGKVVVTANSEEEATELAYDRLEDVSDLTKHHDAFYGTDTSSSVSELYLQDAAETDPDRKDDDV